MSLKYYDAYKNVRPANPKEAYYEDFSAMMDLTFDNAPNVLYNEVEYEQHCGKNDFIKIEKVRVDSVVSFNTGIILGDDYKTLLFMPDFPVVPYYGMKFKWKNSYWLVINTNSYGSLVTSAEIRRCNNVLRFFDSNGERQYEPCILDYTLRFANNQDTATITVGNGEQKVWCQRNERTTTFKANDRFLFGTPEQRVAFSIYGGGIKNYLNNETMDDTSGSLTEIYLDHYEINPDLDDLENGFANAYLNEIKIRVNNPKDTLSVGEKYTLDVSIIKGDTEIESKPYTITTDKPSVFSISDNTVEALKVGEAHLYVTIDDTNIQDIIEVQINDDPIEDIYEIISLPNIDYVLQGESQTFEIYLYKNGEKQNDIFVFQNVTENVPLDKYEITVNDGNSFTIVNKGMYMKNPIMVKCICDEHIAYVNIQLRGLY